MRALLDGDIYGFRSAAASENDTLEIALYRLEEMIENTLNEVQADEFSIFLSGDTNFRYSIYPEYKANRTQPKPLYLKDLKQHLIERHGAVVSDNCEADDLLGIEQCMSASDSTIICSIDKDLRMIPGNHYSFEISGTVKGTRWVKPAERTTVSEFEGTRKFYYQLLVGDTADNIKGASGVGKVTAQRVLAECKTEPELLEATRAYFSCDEELLMNGQCLWIFRKPQDIWQIPEFTS